MKGNAMERVIITGATSSIGIAVLGECIKNGVEVLAVIRKNSTNRDRIPTSNLVEVIECNLNEFHSFPIEEYRVRGYEVFYHLAWENTSKEYRNDAVLQNLNIGYTLDAVNLANKLGCKTFIGAGSQAEYGRVEHIISPDTAVNPDTAYGVAKYCAYKLSSILSKKLGLQHIWGRIFSVYGLYDNKDTMIMYAINQMLNNSKTEFTKCEQSWDYLFTKDAGYAFYLMGKNGIDGSVYCVGSGKSQPLYEYINTIHKMINQELSIGIGKKEYVMNQVMHLCANISSLTRDTGFEPRYSFKEGIAETIQWIEGNNE
jgi:nucleoside-diphosphate-sugar epimerase